MIRLILFVATFFTTYFVGEVSSNTELYPNAGLWYALPLMVILLGHEMGHYVACRWHGVRATLPIFLPMPLPPFGTLGAVIMMRSPMPDRRAIFDIGIAGPLVGLILSIPAIIIGLHLSRVMDAMELLRYYANNKQWLIFLGEPSLFRWLESAIVGKVPEGMALDFHPLAFAGWVGLFVTALNLIPVGQLDGGHILYALFGRTSHLLSRLVVGGALGIAVGVLVLYKIVWEYTVFIVLVFLFSYRFPHPPPINDFDPIGRARKLLGALALVLLCLCFTFRPAMITDAQESFRLHMLQQQQEEEREWTPEDLREYTRKV